MKNIFLIIATIATSSVWAMEYNVEYFEISPNDEIANGYFDVFHAITGSLYGSSPKTTRELGERAKQLIKEHENNSVMRYAIKKAIENYANENNINPPHVVLDTNPEIASFKGNNIDTSGFIPTRYGSTLRIPRKTIHGAVPHV